MDTTTTLQAPTVVHDIDYALQAPTVLVLVIAGITLGVIVVSSVDWEKTAEWFKWRKKRPNIYRYNGDMDLFRRDLNYWLSNSPSCVRAHARLRAHVRNVRLRTDHDHDQ